MRAAANVLLRFVVGLDQRRIDAFAMRRLGGCPGAGNEGRRIELGRGSLVEKDTAIITDIVVEEREFKLGERVTFNAEEFHDIGFGCLTIANDLVSRLPQLPAKAAEARSADD
jgi:hypothetical protein